MPSRPMLTAVGFLAICLAAVSAQEPPAAATADSAANSSRNQPLRIMLTNDDGIKAPGIVAMHKALVAAGHDVTMVAPATQQSGAGTHIHHGMLPLEERGEKQWALTGSPADTVLAGVHHIMDPPPDLVVSGSNFGENMGRSANMSGTVGAAIVAAGQGFPAIAVSVGYDRENPRKTAAAFENAAEFVADLIDQLQSTGDDILPPDTVLNVNYPPLPADQIAGIRHTRLARSNPVTWVHRSVDGGVIRRQIIADPEEADETTDTAWHYRGYITISRLRCTWSSNQALRDEMKDRLSDLQAQSP